MDIWGDKNKLPVPGDDHHHDHPVTTHPPSPDQVAKALKKKVTDQQIHDIFALRHDDDLEQRAIDRARGGVPSNVPLDQVIPGGESSSSHGGADHAQHGANGELVSSASGDQEMSPVSQVPEVRLRFNWSTQTSACNELVSSFALPLDRWIRIGFRMDRHVAIFTDNELVADTATPEIGELYRNIDSRLEVKNLASVLSAMSTRNLGHGTSFAGFHQFRGGVGRAGGAGGGRAGIGGLYHGYGFAGFIADLELSVFDQAVVRLNDGELTNRVSGIAEDDGGAEEGQFHWVRSFIGGAEEELMLRGKTKTSFLI